MNEEAAFRKALTESPEDEPARLAYADWLEERGDARAAWVRDRGLFRFSGPDLRDPLPGLIAALGQKGQGEAVTRGLVTIGARAVPFLLETLRSASEEASNHAAALLGRIGADDPEVVPALVRLLAHETIEVRVAAVRALEALGPAAAPAQPALCQADEDARQMEDYEQSLWLRGHIVRAIGATGAAALPYIDYLLLGFWIDGETADYAVRALIGLGPEVAERVPATVADLDDEERHYPISVLSGLGAAIVPLLLETLGDTEAEPDVRRAAVEALGEIGANEDLLIAA